MSEMVIGFVCELVRVGEQSALSMNAAKGFNR
jgi:hypothetical protein